MSISTHVLDAVSGKPAAGVPVTLLDAGHATLTSAYTDADGRIAALGTELSLGVYRLTFDTAAYFTRTGRKAFFPEVSVVFAIDDGVEHQHVPLLLAPFGYSTYRGS